LAALTDNGITGGTLYSSAIWRGCKICRTVDIADADWKKAAAALRDEHKAAARREREQDQERWAVASARRDLDQTVTDARNKVIAAILDRHSRHLADAEDAARTRWIDENPEQAALIGLIPAGDAEASETTVRFQPEAWINDNAVPVDAEGDVEWTVSSNTATSIAEALERGSDLDFVRYDRYAPDWIREWRGPFTVEVVGDAEGDGE
jgi:hypothetical protein